MMQPLSAAITSFIITFLMTPLIIKYLSHNSIVVIPGKRKIHKIAKPSLGGIAIFLSFMFSSLIWVNMQDWTHIKFLLLAQTIVFIIGVRDDLLPLRPLYKLCGQVVAASVVIFMLDVRISSFYGLAGITEIPDAMSYFLTYLLIIGITNSFNFIDGLDGLAGSLAAIMFLVLGIWFLFAGDPIYSILSFAMLGAILAFLIFNWQPSSIFMGDSGSLFIGLTISIFVIHFMNVNFGLPEASFFKLQNTIGMAICIVVIPLLDTLRIIILRLSKGQSPFTPDKRHVHHAIMRLGLTHGKATLILALIQFLFISLAIIFGGFNDLFTVPGVILLAVAFNFVLGKLIVNKLERTSYQKASIKNGSFIRRKLKYFYTDKIREPV